MKVCPQLSEKMLASAQWVGILGKNGPQCHNDLGRKTDGTVEYSGRRKTVGR